VTYSGNLEEARPIREGRRMENRNRIKIIVTCGVKYVGRSLWTVYAGHKSVRKDAQTPGYVKSFGNGIQVEIRT
jgi:hypothetical protein